MLFDPNGVRFCNLCAFSKSLYQPKYTRFQNVIDNMREIGYYACQGNEKGLAPNDVKNNSVMIFDDVSCERLEYTRHYLSMGRHNEIDSFYLHQLYT